VRCVEIASVREVVIVESDAAPPHRDRDPRREPDRRGGTCASRRSSQPERAGSIRRRMTWSRPHRIHRIIAEVARPDYALPADAGDDHVLCHLFERIVRGEARIVAVLPEGEHLGHRRPPDTEPAWDRMGDPVRCQVSGGTQSRGEPRRCWVSPAIRAHYRERIRSGFW
jgi:hypothetical protein